MAYRITVIVRDESPLAVTDTPGYRTVAFRLNEAQSKALAFGRKETAERCILEKVDDELPASFRRRLPDVLRPEVGRAQMIVSLVAAHFDVTDSEMRSSARNRRVLVPRQIAIALIRRHTTLTYAEIGAYFNRDHSTIVHSVQSIELGVKESTAIREAVEQLSREVRELLAEEFDA